MKLHFLGTRGYIKVTSALHRMHTSLLVLYRGKKLMIDCGADWRKKVWTIAPDAILLTHGHPDHAWGLAEGSPAPVYAAAETWALINTYPIVKQHQIIPRTPQKILGMTVEAFRVVHSLRCPAIGYRITAGKNTIFYISDVVDIADRHEALSGIGLYIGDGATITRPLVRRNAGGIFGHTTIRAQIGWCSQEGVPRAVFTHCGTQIVKGNKSEIRAKIQELA
ncbi:MAG TPA: MBL fold metallo-hydrolase, partial [Saprospiraceae bacterium]|nr:MBL fold metallo-hydrolase [Saprospiraceae bacterium]